MPAARSQRIGALVLGGLLAGPLAGPLAGARPVVEGREAGVGLVEGMLGSEPTAGLDRDINAAYQALPPPVRAAAGLGAVHTAEFLWDTLAHGDAWGVDDAERNGFVRAAQGILGCPECTVVDLALIAGPVYVALDCKCVSTAAELQAFDAVVQRIAAADSYTKAAAMAADLAAGGRFLFQGAANAGLDVLGAEDAFDDPLTAFYTVATQVLRLLLVYRDLYVASPWEDTCVAIHSGGYCVYRSIDELSRNSRAIGASKSSSTQAPCTAPSLLPNTWFVRPPPARGQFSREDLLLFESARTFAVTSCGQHLGRYEDFMLNTAIRGPSVVKLHDVNQIRASLSHINLRQQPVLCPDGTAGCLSEVFGLGVSFVGTETDHKLLWLLDSAKILMQVTEGFRGGATAEGYQQDALSDALAIACGALPAKFHVLTSLLGMGCADLAEAVVLVSQGNYWIDNRGFWGEMNGVTFSIYRSPFVAAEQANVGYRFDVAPHPDDCPSMICRIGVQRSAILGYTFPRDSGPEQKYWGWHTVQQVNIPIVVADPKEE